MIGYEEYYLNNGLQVILHQDASTPMVVVNTAYKVGSRDESKDKTGFAHLFEHLMFGGSKNAPDFDTPIQMAGGENNAFTNSDMTNFYNVLPAINLETALWLESDRMMQLNINSKTLGNEQKVVIEEFKETCLNQPYGDLWHHINDLAYQEHPYNWPTIGKVPEHISDAQLSDVEGFYNKYYRPNNAVLVVAGDIDISQTKSLIEKYFEEIPRGEKIQRNYRPEPKQQELRDRVVRANVPLETLVMAFPMCDRHDERYYACDLLSDILANGMSSRFFINIYKKSYCSTIDAFISGTFDPGLFLIEAKPVTGVTMDEVKSLIWQELDLISTELISDDELAKIKNKAESSLIYSEVSILHKAMNLAYYAVLGDTAQINMQTDKYAAVTAEDIRSVAAEIFDRERHCELLYIPTPA